MIFLRGHVLFLSRCTENAGGRSGSKSYVLSSSCGKDRDTLCIVVFLSLFFFPILAELIHTQWRMGGLCFV